MRLAEITVVISVPGDPDDNTTDEMTAAYDDLSLPGVLRTIVEDHLDSRIALAAAYVTIIEG